MPRRAFTTLRFSLAGNLVQNAAPWTNDAQFSLNSINSPNATHQPLAHDEWATFYNRYVVLGADVEISMVNTTSQSTPNSVHAAIVASNNSTAISAPSSAMEQWSGTKLLELGNGSTPISFKRSYNLRDLYGVNDETILSDARFQAGMAADPTEFAQLHIVTSKDGATAYNVAFTVNILYHVVFFDALQLAQS